MDKNTACEGYFPALIVVCIILTLTVCLMTALPHTHALEDDTSAPSDSTSEPTVGSAEASSAPIFPLDGRITSGFAWRDDPFFDASAGGEADTEFHRGIDISAARSRDIRACADGTVCFVGRSAGYGNYLMLDHGGWVSLYAHCAELLVEDGDLIRAGDSIAVAGATGRATGPHLHFEIRVDGQPVDPLDYVGSVYAGVDP